MNVLTLRAVTKAEEERKEASYLVRERRIGSFYRALRLPETLDANKVHSTFDNGILTVNLPKAEEKKKKQIKIKVGTELLAGESSAKK